MPELLIHGAAGETRLPFSDEPLLSDLLANHPDSPGKPCGGGGKCGQCAVYASGALFPVPDENGKVLSCQARLCGDAEVWLPRHKAMKQIETEAKGEAYPLSPLIGQYALAVDIGTTTLAMRLIRLSDGAILSTVASENPQRTMAADVIGRIEGALNGRLELLTSMIQESLHEMEAEAIRLAGLPIQSADYRIITGNTTMLYLFTHRSPECLSRAPFQADCLFDYWNGRDYYPPCAGAFVGADITCALLFSGICSKNDTALLIDIGTNGEIALWHNGKISCCATAAGPAFEGGGIECGCGSIPGAISSAKAIHGEISYTTIENEEAKGICGSGLIDLTAAMLDLEMLDESGILDNDEIIFSPNAKLTQKDIRQIQLAKGAIAAGIRSLVHHAEITMKDITALYIAGGFGSHLNLQSAARIGLIPEELLDKAVVLGNASLGGAQRLLLDNGASQRIRDLTQNTECLNLASSPFFSDAFIECMMFESSTTA